jgi:hypothetical protein
VTHTAHCTEPKLGLKAVLSVVPYNFNHSKSSPSRQQPQPGGFHQGKRRHHACKDYRRKKDHYLKD